MSDLITIGGTAVTMTSLELVEFINSQRKPGEPELTHANFLAKVPKVLGEGGLIHFQDTYLHPQNGQKYPCYRFPKRESCLMAMSYSYDLQAKVFDRMTALEEQVKNSVPSIETDEGKLLMIQSLVVKQLTLINENKEIKADRDQAVAQTVQVQAEMKLLTPKAEALDRIAMADGMLNLQTAGKVLQQPPNKFIQQLRELRWIYKPPGCTTNRAHVEKINTGYLACKAYEMTMPDGTTRVRDQVLVTPKGLAKLALLFGARPEFGVSA